jgi:hypothetical protein
MYLAVGRGGQACAKGCGEAAFVVRSFTATLSDKTMIDAKQAVKKAMTYLNDMFDTTEFKDVFTEAVELSDDDRFWDVTIGFLRRQVSTSEGPMASLVGPTEGFKREVKVFRIDAESGTVRSMKTLKGD